jgi:hypothetical protein
MPNIYQDALYAQSACNLSGLVHALPGIIDVIKDEARENKDILVRANVDKYVNEHPVIRLFVEQLLFLSSTCKLRFHENPWDFWPTLQIETVEDIVTVLLGTVKSVYGTRVGRETGTAYINGHPVVRLLVEQLKAKVGHIDYDSSYRLCEIMKKEGDK